MDNLLTDTVYYNQSYYKWWSNKPVLTGNSTGWTDFSVQLAGFGTVFNIQPEDTVQYRFTFISDSIQTNKDDLHFEDWSEVIMKSQNQFDSNVFPNPASDKIDMQFPNDKNEPFEFVLFDNSGKSVLMKQTINNDRIEIDLSSYNPGIYFYRLSDQNNQTISTGKIIKQ